ncbi:MAG: pyruvate kinase [Negativicutes bacterium]
MDDKALSNDPGIVLDTLLELREKVTAEGLARFREWYPGIDRLSFIPSALNLAFYLALRRRDLRDLQRALKPLGLSSLGRSEAGAIANLDAVIASLSCIVGRQAEVGILHPRPEKFYKGEWSLNRQTALVLGPKPLDRKVRIMVTLSALCATDYPLVRQLLASGMNIARINCAHENRDTWEAIIANVRRAEQELKKPCKVFLELAGPKIRIDQVVLSGESPKVRTRNQLFLTSGDPVVHENVVATISCTAPDILSFLQVGDPVHIDDGRITCRVEDVFPTGVLLKVLLTAKMKPVKLKIGKGLHLHSGRIKMPAITEKDLQDLDFIVTVADAVGVSFVRSADDIAVLQEELGRRMAKGKRPLPIMAKIETFDAVGNLPEIIVKAAAHHPFALMIARGDLAMEVGYERLAELQEEILWVSEAAHVPVIWATQVLENLVKYGTPSRAEITDAAMSERAECVMLNKGPFLVDAVELLDNVLTRMDAHQRKKTPRLRALKSFGKATEA